MEISVVIPVRNEADNIRLLLDGLLGQTLAPVEIVITDSGSTDSTAEIISEYVKCGAPVRLLREKFALPGRGRNVAAAHVTNPWIAFIDAGIRPEPTWLEELAKRACSQENVDVVYGNYEPITDSLFKLCAVMAYITPIEYEGQPVRPCSVASTLMKRGVWEKVGGFPETLRSAEDLLFMRKIESADFKTVRAPAALVHWQVQPTAWRTFKRFFSYARNNMRAGLWNEWQKPVFTRYGLLLLSILPVIWFGSRWLLVTAVLWLALLCARGAKAIWVNRRCYPGSIVQNMLRLPVLMLVIALLDAATFAGTLQWAIKDRLFSKHSL